MFIAIDGSETTDAAMNYCGDMPMLATVSILREHLPALKLRIVDLMRLQPHTEHWHGLMDADFNALFVTDKLIIFAFHVCL